MQAINYYVVIEKIKQEPTKIAGLIISDALNEDNRYLKGKIISAGTLVEGVKKDDIIHFDRHAGHGINWKDKLYHIITVKDIVLVE
jgi:co-chaperonin GroES (HSP10)|tara:strand:- start:1274 stop:1531 length:258 start_codon:yes stop_codon:yes gene_type:complete